jgi:signal transduction histidine kinase
MLNLLHEGYLGASDERQEKTIMRCQLRIEALKGLINDLLKLGEKRSEAAKMALYRVDLAATMNQLMDSYRAQAAEKGLDIRFNIQDTVLHILANEKIVDELFTNLISNAIKYTPSGGKVEVTLSREGRESVRFEVSDTGIGIAEQDQTRLFTEFFRTENAKALTEEGTGLGLVIVKEILDRLGGTITVKSAVGQGTSFTCVIPSMPEP